VQTTALGRQNVAVIGSGIAGLSAAWLLSQTHDVTIFEADGRLGGHANTAEAPGFQGPVPVDTGFIVYNEANYPNLTALFAYLGAPTINADMSLSVSLDDGAFEYSSFGFSGVFAQKRNLANPRFLKMLTDVTRFYREAPADLERLGDSLVSLDDYLRQKGFGRAFRDDHLIPQAAAIWSTPLDQIGAYPAASLIRFFLNHGMMTVSGRGLWRTVAGGSRAYVEKLLAVYGGQARTGAKVAGLKRDGAGVELRLAGGARERFDQAGVATHGDTALSLLDDPTPEETRLPRPFATAATSWLCTQIRC
jgi:predicted NAD/FAD-binding protein